MFGFRARLFFFIFFKYRVLEGASKGMLGSFNGLPQLARPSKANSGSLSKLNQIGSPMKARKIPAHIEYEMVSSTNQTHV